GVAPFLVLRERRDGSVNGVRIRQLKDKLGTKAVASAEIELVDAEGFLLAPSGDESDNGEGAADGRGLGRMMALTNGARLGIAMMGLGCARRALVESLCYARRRDAFGSALAEQPLMQRKLAELVVEVEATQALVFDAQLGPTWDRGASRLRLGAPLAKLRAARLGIVAASDAIEVHGGNGYIEQWPVARLLRDAQVNTVWEGPDNILCLDVRRAMVRDEAHVALFARVESALGRTDGVDVRIVDAVTRRFEDLRALVERWSRLDGPAAEARLYPLAQCMIDVYAGALLAEQAGEERRRSGGTRKELVAGLYNDRHLTPGGHWLAVDSGTVDIDRFKELCDGALVEDRL
ncbi:MAG: acyl-CoA dehydrogenase family protein, partial [Acidimicrobiales bacterium]